MPYRIELLPEAEDNLDRLDAVLAGRILGKLEWFAERIDQLSPEALTGRYQGLYRLRVGSYRVIYDIDRRGQVIVVHAARHRREAYR